MSAQSRIAARVRVRRTAAGIVVALVFVLVAAFLADLVAASRAEHRLARALLASPTLAYEPEVMLSGFPFWPNRADTVYREVHISARGVPISGCADRGACHADLDARLHQSVLGSPWRVGPDTELRFSSLTAETRIDSVNLGRLMNIVDLYINTPAPAGKVGGGGPQDGLLERTDGIMLSGTVPLPGSPERDGKYPPSASEYRHPKVKVSVSARVDVVDGRLRLTAEDFYTGPEEHFSADVPPEFRSAVLKFFSVTLPVVPLAWNTTPTSALSRGSDLVLQGSAPEGMRTPRSY